MEIKNVGVVGCGVMGAGITQLCAQTGYSVTVSEANNDILNKGIKSIESILGRLVEKGLLKTIEGEPSPERGGRRKLFFRLTKEGKKALLEVQRVNSAIWQDMPSLKTG